MSTSIHDLLLGHGLVAVPPHASSTQAAQLMEREAVGCLAVQDETGQVLGIVTDRDLALRVASCPCSKPEEVEVASVMSTPALSIDGRENLDAAIQAMRERGVRRLVVTDPRGRAQTILALDDLIGELAGDLGRLVPFIPPGVLRGSPDGHAPPANRS